MGWERLVALRASVPGPEPGGAEGGWGGPCLPWLAACCAFIIDKAKHGELLMPMGKENWSGCCAEGLPCRRGHRLPPEQRLRVPTTTPKEGRRKSVFLGGNLMSKSQ